MAPHQSACLLDLPDEVLIHVISYLPYRDRILHVRQTCSRFCQLSLAPSLWKSLTVEAERGERRLSRLLGQQCIRGPWFESDGREMVNQGNSTVEVKNIATSVREYGRVAPSCSVTGHMIYPKLKCLKLVSPDFPQMSSLARYSALQWLAVKSRDSKSGNNLAECFNVLKDLKELRRLFVSVGRVANSADAVVQNSIRDYFLSGPKVTSVSLGLDVNEDIVRAIVDNCTELQVLLLLLCKFDLPGAFSAVKPSLSLWALVLGNYPGWDDKCLQSIRVAFPNITHLLKKPTAGTSSTGLTYSFRGCPGFERIELGKRQGL